MRGVVGLVGKVSEKERGFFWVVVKEYFIIIRAWIYWIALLRLESIRWIDFGNAV
jgi:hypothetical protein